MVDQLSEAIGPWRTKRSVPTNDKHLDRRLKAAVNTRPLASMKYVDKRHRIFDTTTPCKTAANKSTQISHPDHWEESNKVPSPNLIRLTDGSWVSLTMAMISTVLNRHASAAVRCFDGAIAATLPKLSSDLSVVVEYTARYLHLHTAHAGEAMPRSQRR